MAGHLLFNSGSNESSLAPQFKWLDNTFKQVKAYSLIPKYLRFIKNKVLSYVKTTILVEYLLKRKNYYL
jgi:hypothetical protein